MNDLKWSVVLCFVSTSSTVCIHVRSYCGELNVNLVLLSLVHLYLCHLSSNVVLSIEYLCVQSYLKQLNLYHTFSYKLFIVMNQIYFLHEGTCVISLL